MREVQAERAMGERRGDGVFEVIDAVATVFPAVAIVDPRVCVLMHEQRHANGREITVAFVAITIAPQGIPAVSGNRVARRSDGEHVEKCVFAVGVPTRFEKTSFGLPSVREEPRIAVEHPAKVDAVVNPGGESRDFGIAGKTLPHREYTREQ